MKKQVNTLLVGAIVLLLVNIFLLGSELWVEYKILSQKEWEGCKSCQMYNPDVKWGIQGIYRSSEDYYCIWTKGKTHEEQNKTLHHETCHHFVHEDKNHFCDKYYYQLRPPQGEEIEGIY